MSQRNPPYKFISSRKAQDASSAATLIAVIALLIVFYLLFIPPSFRDQILEGNATTTTQAGADALNETILRASPGTLSKISSEFFVIFIYFLYFLHFFLNYQFLFLYFLLS